MKTEMKAVVASIVVIALALTAVSGITYSWFSASEEAQINVSTGAIDYQATFEVTKSGGEPVTGTSGIFTIENMIPGDFVKVKVSVANASTIDTVYRAYVEVLSGTGSTLAAEYLDQFTINGVGFTSYGDKIVVTNWTTAPANANFDIPEFKLLFENDTSMSSAESAELMGKAVSFKVVVEGYQGNYPITFDEDSSTISVPTNGLISGTVKTADASAEDIPVSITLPASTAGEDLTLSITKDATGSAPKYTIGASLTSTSSFTEPVKMTITVDGDYSAGNVIYLGTTGEQPTIISAVYDGTKTTITFTTLHFSKFMIANDVVAVADTDDGVKAFSTLVDAFANVKTGGTIRLVSDSTGSGIGVFETKSGFVLNTKDSGITVNSNITLDFDGYTYTIGKPAVGSVTYETQGFHLERGYTLKMTNGTLNSDGKDPNVKMLVQNYCDLTLDNMVLDGTNVAWDYTFSNNNGTVMIKDTTIIAKEGGFAFDVYGNFHENYTGPSVTVTGSSKITGIIEFDVKERAVTGTTHTLIIESGDFSKATLKVGKYLSCSKIEIGEDTLTGAQITGNGKLNDEGKFEFTGSPYLGPTSE